MLVGGGDETSRRTERGHHERDAVPARLGDLLPRRRRHAPAPHGGGGVSDDACSVTDAEKTKKRTPRRLHEPALHQHTFGAEVLADLREEAWVLYSPRRKRPLWEFVRARCAAAGFTPRKGAEAVDEEEAVRLVSQGRLVALVSEGTRSGREYVKRQLVEGPRICIAAAWRRNDERPELRALVETVARAAPATG
jgi:hypothetical protein